MLQKNFLEEKYAADTDAEEFLGVIRTKVLRVFLLAIDRHLY
jgi:hypothetical protein